MRVVAVAWFALLVLGTDSARAQRPAETVAVPAPIPAVRLAELHAMVLDPARSFSVSRTLAELDKLEPRTTPDSADRGEVAFLRGLVAEKGGRTDMVVAPSLEALRIDAAHPFLQPHDRLMTEYRVAKHAKDSGDCRAAIPHYRRQVPLAAADPALTDDQRFGIRESLGYCLHETKAFAEALAVNQALLADAVAAFGAQDARLLPVLINLAQNRYELRDPAAARATLLRVLDTATVLHDAGHVDTALFQLGVLAYEQGQPDEARRRMRERLRLAQEGDDPDRTAHARRDLDILEDKLAR